MTTFVLEIKLAPDAKIQEVPDRVEVDTHTGDPDGQRVWLQVNDNQPGMDGSKRAVEALVDLDHDEARQIARALLEAVGDR